jgi:phenylalanine-4-hydroxylase
VVKEATTYAPIIRIAEGDVTVEFSSEHPGFPDLRYQRHRAGIAKAALEYRSGQPLPEITYLDEEHECWRLLSKQLGERHERHACDEIREGMAQLGLPTQCVPQLSDVAAVVQDLTGFSFRPAAGLVDQFKFYSSLADREFQATQYVRHYSAPWFSPEPDMIHEIIGHGSALAGRRLADIYELLGKAVRQLESTEAVSAVSKVFWFALEYGLVRERGEIRVCGASMLSSCGEMDQFHTAQIRPLDIPSMVTQAYRVDEFQSVLFCADSFNHLEEFLSSYLTSVTDDNPMGDTLAAC